MVDAVKLRAEAKTLGIEGYRKMSTSELQAAIKGKTSKAAPAATPNGDKPKGRKSAVKAATKTATAKPASRKSASASKSAAKSAPAKSAKSGTAKRPTAGGARKQAQAKPAARTKGRDSQRDNRPSTKAQANGAPGRMAIDNAAIDWTAASNVGNSGGNREVIMKLLRKHRGNVEKVFAALAEKAQEMYGKNSDGRRRTKDSARSLLRWHISRVKFDFVKDTGQHEGVTRSNGTQAQKPSSARKSAAKPKAGSRPASKPAGRQKAAQKPVGGRKSAGSKSNAARKTTAASRKRGK